MLLGVIPRLTYRGHRAGNYERSSVLITSWVNGQFSCQVWDGYGMAPADENIYIYGVFAPKFLSAQGKEHIVFSTMRNRFGSLKDGIVTFPNGGTQPAKEFYESICGAGVNRPMLR